MSKPTAERLSDAEFVFIEKSIRAGRNTHEQEVRLIDSHRAISIANAKLRTAYDAQCAELERVRVALNGALTAAANATEQRDAARAEAARYHDALVARHGGEPVSLLAELDAARAEAEAARRKAIEDCAAELSRLARKWPSIDTAMAHARDAIRALLTKPEGEGEGAK